MEEIEESIEVKEGVTQDTAHEHYYCEYDEHSTLKDVYCKECGSGMQIAKNIEVKDGKVLWKKS